MALIAIALVAASCSQDTKTVDVFAASSLTDAFTELESRYEAANPGIDIRLNLAGSNTLLRQIIDGAPADVFAPADAGYLTDPDLLSQHRQIVSTIFAGNTLVAIVPIDSDLKILDDLFQPGLILTRCADGVPCGVATNEWLDSQNVSLGQQSMEANVRSVLTKVRLGEADGGFVYRTDALAASQEVRIIELDTGGTASPTVSVGIADLSDSDGPARDFVQFVLSDTGAEVLSTLGFDQP